MTKIAIPPQGEELPIKNTLRYQAYMTRITTAVYQLQAHPESRECLDAVNVARGELDAWCDRQEQIEAAGESLLTASPDGRCALARGVHVMLFDGTGKLDFATRIVEKPLAIAIRRNSLRVAYLDDGNLFITEVDPEGRCDTRELAGAAIHDLIEIEFADAGSRIVTTSYVQPQGSPLAREPNEQGRYDLASDRGRLVRVTYSWH